MLEPLTPETYRNALDYTSPIPLFATGAAAADHGQAAITTPSPAAVRSIDKILRARGDIADSSPGHNPAEGSDS